MDSLVWFLILLGPLLFIQRRLHREIQVIFLIATRRQDISLILFSLLFFPGVLLHEASHYLAARSLGVRTGRFSLVPQPMANGRLRLGYVETAATDWFRETLIGAAPLLSGGIVVAYIGLEKLGLSGLWDALLAKSSTGWFAPLLDIFGREDFWLWFYLAVVVGGTMLPSPSDRRTWMPLGAAAGFLFAGSLLLGAGPWMLGNFGGPFERILSAVDGVLAICIFVHTLLLFPVYLLRRCLSRYTGLQPA